MIFQGNNRTPAWLFPVAVCALTVLALPVRAQEPPAQREELRAVIRISNRLIEEVASREEITAAIPYRDIVLGFCCEGIIYGQGKVTVDLSAAQSGTFIINAHGTGQTYARAVRGPIVAWFPAWGPFTSRTLVRFDGRKFILADTTTCAEVHGHLDKVEGRHGGCVGRAVGCVIRPAGQLLVPRAEKQAEPIAEYSVTNFVNELGREIVGKLNQSTRIEESLDRLFPEAKGWVFQITTGPDFIQSAYGPPGSPAPVLPPNPNRSDKVRLEVWLHSTSKHAAPLAKLANQPLAKQLVQAYLKATVPELAALSGDQSVAAVGPWLVISIGPPKAD
jgi:hypothetical protein